MMNSKKIYMQLAYYKKILEEKGYDVIYIGLYGSQNYNLDDEESDIDVKAIVSLNLSDIINRKKVSKTIECNIGNIDVKDLLTFYEVIRKGNFSYIESINTEYSIGDKYIKELFKNVPVNKKSILGAMYEKRKALTHEYPSKKYEFEKWGFDPKQLHHIIRLKDLLLELNLTGSNNAYLRYDDNGDKQYMIDVKRNKGNLSLKFVETIADEIIKFSKTLIPDNYKYEFVDLSREVNKYIENKIKLQLRNSRISYSREYRTFDNGIPKKDLQKFPILKEYADKDISYIVTESIEIL